MNLIEVTPLASADFPIAELKDFLRLGSGFTDDASQDGVIEACLRAAIGAIEVRTSRALILRQFRWSVFSFRKVENGILLPITPIVWIDEVKLYGKDGNWFRHPIGTLSVVSDGQRPVMTVTEGELPKVPDQGRAAVLLNAGYGPWSAVPAPLQQAVLMLAGAYFENRETMVTVGAQMPLSVASLLAPFQRIRMGMGA